MEQSDSLRKMLQNLTGIYHDDQLDVGFSRETKILPTGHVYLQSDLADQLNVEEDSANELRLLVDTLNHEVEHYRETDLLGKDEFAKEYPQTPVAAAFVNNVVEDAFVDKNRTDRFRGMRRTTAFKADTVMDDDDRRPPLDELDPSEAMVEGMVQVSLAGYAKGIENADSNTQAFLGEVRPKIDSARRETDFEEREEITREIVEAFQLHCQDIEKAESYIERTDLPTDDIPQLSQSELDELVAESAESAEGAEGDEGGQSGGTGQQDDDARQLDVDADQPEVSLPWWLKPLGALVGLGTVATLTYLYVSGILSLLQLTLIVTLLLILLWLLLSWLGGQMQAAASASAGASGQGEQGEQGESGESSSADGSADADASGEADADTGNEDSETADMTDAEVEQALEEMEEQSEQSESRDWYGVDDDVDYSEASEEMQQRFEQLQDMESADFGELESERDDVLDRLSDTADEAQQTIRERGLEQEIEEAFKQLKTRDRDVAARRGKRLHTRNAVRRRAGDTSEDRLYYRRQKAETGDRAIGVAVDLSGSMDQHETRVALGALSIATGIIGDQLVARGYTVYDGLANMVTHDGSIALPLITGPDEDFEWDHLNMVQANGKTPTPAGIQGTRQLLRRCNRPEKTLIVITDGKPNYANVSGEPVQLSTEEVRRCKRNGITVIGMGVGPSIDQATMGHIFGDDGYVMVAEDDIAEKLVEIYRGQMNVA